MMLQPRSFLFTRSPSPKSRDSKDDPVQDEKRINTIAKQDKKIKRDMPATRTATESRPTTPSSPVIIPMRGSHDAVNERKRPQMRKESVSRRQVSDQSERRSRTVHSPDALPPSVAALLAITSIPPQRNTTRPRNKSSHRLTVDAIMQHTGASEKEYHGSLGKGPLDFLLSSPEEEDEVAESETGHESIMSARTMSSESMPSLDDESVGEPSPSLYSLVTPNSASGPRSRRTPKRIHSLPSIPQNLNDHPLFAPDIDVDELDFRVFGNSAEDKQEKAGVEIQPRYKSAFKSNLTASLRALRSAAKSFSALTSPMIPPDDFLTRSIISIDPQVPFTDERMPPRLEDTPTPELRRYLNPTTNAPIEAHMPSSIQARNSECTASIQMQTYKISRHKKTSLPSVISRRTVPTPEEAFAEITVPLARQRDMRENSDFIRVAVMEMLMRKKGKLDDQKPGRARWALPPRKPPTKPYQISANGIPVRWIATSV